MQLKQRAMGSKTLILLSLIFAFSEISVADEYDLESKPLCPMNIEMRDGCDGQQKCRCPENSVCDVASVEDRLSVCISIEVEPDCYYTNSKTNGETCEDCFCPNGYFCLEQFTIDWQTIVKCVIEDIELPTTTIVTTVPTPTLPMCESPPSGFSDLCDITCVCPMGYECRCIGFDCGRLGAKRCFLIGEPATLVPATTSTTTLPDTVAADCPARWVPCAAGCTCPDEYQCKDPLFWEDDATCQLKTLGEQQGVIDRVDELADDAIDLAKQQMHKVQQIHTVIVEDEENDEI